MNDQERKALEAAREALHTHAAHWMAVAPILGANAWTRWGNRACNRAEPARLAVDAALAASDAPNTFPFPEVRDASLLGIGAKYETEDGRSVTLDPRKLILLYRHGTAPDVELKPAQLEAAANAVRRELGNAKVLSECSECRMAEVCRDVVRAVLDATAFHPSR